MILRDRDELPSQDSWAFPRGHCSDLHFLNLLSERNSRVSFHLWKPWRTWSCSQLASKAALGRTTKLIKSWMFLLCLLSPGWPRAPLSLDTSTNSQLFLPGAPTEKASQTPKPAYDLSSLAPSDEDFQPKWYGLSPLSKNDHCHVTHRNASGGFPGFQMNARPHAGKTCLASLWHSLSPELLSPPLSATSQDLFLYPDTA